MTLRVINWRASLAIEPHRFAMSLLFLAFVLSLCQDDDLADMACLRNDSVPCIIGNAHTVCRFEAPLTSTLTQPYPFVPDCRLQTGTYYLYVCERECVLHLGVRKRVTDPQNTRTHVTAHST